MYNQNILNMIRISDLAKELVIENLAKNGFCIVDSEMENEQELIDLQLKICSWLGSIREHNEGKKDYVWPICLKESDSSIKTFSEHNQEAELHTDTQYRDLPERYMTLSCVNEANCGGGETFLLDSQVILDRIKNDHVLLNELQQDFPIAVPDIFHYEGKKFIERPIIANYPKFRFRYDTFKKGLLLQNPPDLNQKMNVLDSFFDLIKNAPEMINFTLKKGQIILIDNHRLLHGRSSFVDVNRLLYRVRVDDFN